MADIHLHRQHTLGLDAARKVASQWTQTLEQQFEMTCRITTSEHNDLIEFARPGANGKLVVAGDHFELHAKLGFLLSAFSTRIRSELEKNLDELLKSPTPAAEACQRNSSPSTKRQKAS